MDKPKFNPLSLAKVGFKPKNCYRIKDLKKQIFKFFDEHQAIRDSEINIVKSKRLKSYGIKPKSKDDTTDTLLVPLAFQAKEESWILELQASKWKKDEGEITFDTTVARKFQMPVAKFMSEVDQASKLGGLIPDHIFDHWNFGPLERTDINNQFMERQGYFFSEKGCYPTTVGAMIQSALQRIDRLGNHLGTTYSKGVILVLNDQLFVMQGGLLHEDYKKWLDEKHPNIAWKRSSTEIEDDTTLEL